jgi:hypothetical protein
MPWDHQSNAAKTLNVPANSARIECEVPETLSGTRLRAVTLAVFSDATLSGDCKVFGLATLDLSGKHERRSSRAHALQN